MIAQVNPNCLPRFKRKHYVQPARIDFGPILPTDSLMAQQEIGSPQTIFCKFKAGGTIKIVDR